MNSSYLTWQEVQRKVVPRQVQWFNVVINVPEPSLSFCSIFVFSMSSGLQDGYCVTWRHNHIQWRTRRPLHATCALLLGRKTFHRISPLDISSSPLPLPSMQRRLGKWIYGIFYNEKLYNKERMAGKEPEEARSWRPHMSKDFAFSPTDYLG